MRFDVAVEALLVVEVVVGHNREQRSVDAAAGCDNGLVGVDVNDVVGVVDEDEDEGAAAAAAAAE